MPSYLDYLPEKEDVLDSSSSSIARRWLSLYSAVFGLRAAVRLLCRVHDIDSWVHRFLYASLAQKNANNGLSTKEFPLISANCPILSFKKKKICWLVIQSWKSLDKFCSGCQHIYWGWFAISLQLCNLLLGGRRGVKYCQPVFLPVYNFILQVKAGSSLGIDHRLIQKALAPWVHTLRFHFLKFLMAAKKRPDTWPE